MKIAIFLLSVSLYAQEPSQQAWKISLAPFIAGQALDISSSYGMRELNPLLASSNGGFEMKALSLKAAVTGAAILAEWAVIHRFPRSARVIAKLNWSTGLVTTGFAVHNYAIK